MNWQPIETAPKDGSVLVVADGAVGEAHYAIDCGWFWINNHPTDSWGGQIYPTHWMPLPPPPEARS